MKKGNVQQNFTMLFICFSFWCYLKTNLNRTDNHETSRDLKIGSCLLGDILPRAARMAMKIHQMHYLLVNVYYDRGNKTFFQS